MAMDTDCSLKANIRASSFSAHADKALSQARDEFQATVRQVGAASLAVECVTLQVHDRSCVTGRSGSRRRGLIHLSSLASRAGAATSPHGVSVRRSLSSLNAMRFAEACFEARRWPVLASADVRFPCQLAALNCRLVSALPVLQNCCHHVGRTCIALRL